MKNRTTIIFDFDGTIALGDGPVLAYAQQAAAEIGAPESFVEGIRQTLAAGGDDALDGYDAVRRAADVAGADAGHLSRAYLASRGQLGTADAPITAPEGLAQFLAEADAHRILVTNAPDVRLNEALASLGLDGLFDRIVTSARKPAGIDRILDELPAGSRVLSIGDIWHNDLAPVHRRGHATALVGDFFDPDADPTFRAATLTTLLPQLREWLAGSADSTSDRTALTTLNEG
ncbi:HAD family hydrolase [Microbacterium murale]|uniref:Phosphoglycolate phosphatase-like HAD superfamily hydrolase n=1 Tax=Microbacterium murale TaxID=1081040 RepID=A0ABU0P593_9MICO|nr:HAD family hydrolase [Microbacterium murale]MDQ0642488.1 phosphoglycolate phosphatase-like HAD superfamily hydrolase [Microbacterium murale]